ncbi:Uncharacterized protein Gasu2_43370 [Galdieria sulphuraria]|nr:Uncharacterized protein Gasu2_43370 [Galdieria sulphuraria]
MFLFVPLSSPMFRLLKRNRIVLQSLKCYRCELVVAVLYSDQFQLHQPPNGTRHPECPGRVTTTMRHLESSPIFSSLQLLPFEDEPCDDTWLKKRILSIHSVGYLEDLERWINQGAKSLDADTYLCDKSLEL